jgi:hypothetical protein
MVLDRKGISCQLLALGFGRQQIVRYPVIRFIEVDHDPKHLARPVTFEMHDATFLADLDVLDSPVTCMVRIDLTIGFEAC